MTDKMIWACMVMMAIAVVSILFIRRAILYRRRIRENIRSYIRSDIPTQGRGNTVYEERFLFTPRAPFSSPKSLKRQGEMGFFPKSKKDTYRFDKKVNDKMEKFIAGIQIENVAGTCFTAEFV